MALMKRSRSEMDWPEWPEWLAGRRLFDWPEHWLAAGGDTPLRLEQFEEDGAMAIRADLPGVDPEKDIEITVTDHTLRIKAERRQETTREDTQGYRSEFRYGSFVRTVALPAGASEAEVRATYADGVLEVRVPVDATRTDEKRIPIARG